MNSLDEQFFLHRFDSYFTREFCTNFPVACQDEDCTKGDVTADLLEDPMAYRELQIVSRENGFLSGLSIIRAGLPSNISLDVCTKDGEYFEGGECLAVLKGGHSCLVSIERTILNILGHLSGIATCASKYVGASENIPVFDTRKTTPTLRKIEKYACFCGGASMHRENLADAVMIKDNHIDKQGESFSCQVNKMISNIKSKSNISFVEVEVDTVEQLEELLKNKHCHLDILLLDNFSVDDLFRSVYLRNKYDSKILLEASGGINLQNIKSVAATGVDRIATGAMIREAVWIDIGADWE